MTKKQHNFVNSVGRHVRQGNKSIDRSSHVFGLRRRRAKAVYSRGKEERGRREEVTAEEKKKRQFAEVEKRRAFELEKLKIRKETELNSR